MMKRMAVGIVSHNTRELLRECLDSVVRQDPAQLVVADNASMDGSAEMVRAEFPGALLCRNEMNRGYGAAANQVMARCSAAYVLLLNADTRLKPGALQALCAFMDRHPQAAIVGPRIVNPNGSLQQSCFPFPTPLAVFLDVSNLGRLTHFLPFLRESYLPTWSHTRARAVPWVLGAALAIRREAFEQAGGFDESFFMFYEEADLCYRLEKMGWQVYFAPVTEIVHVGGASTRQRASDMQVQLYSGLVHFYRRHYSRKARAALGVLIEAVALGRWIRDWLSLRVTADAQKRAQLAVSIEAWRRLLFGQWRGQTVSL